MKKLRLGKFSILCVVLGLALMLSSLAIWAVSAVSAEQANKNARVILEQAIVMMPQATDQVPEERGNNAMAAMEIDGVNIAGVLEVEKYGAELPLAASWDKGLVSSMPCRFTGSIYDSSLIIGAVDSEGQFSFASQMNVNDTIVLTDMEGGRYTYRVETIQHAKHATRNKLQQGDYALTIFVKDSRNSQYLLIRCNPTFG